MEVPARPDFDRSEYLAISNSQRSAEGQRLISPIEENDPETRARISQTTIPDSQEITDSVSYAATFGDLIPDKLSQTETQATDLHSPSASVSDRGIDQPSQDAVEEHPNLSSLSFGERQVVTESNSLHSSALAPEVASNLATSPAGPPAVATDTTIMDPPKQYSAGGAIEAEISAIFGEDFDISGPEADSRAVSVDIDDLLGLPSRPQQSNETSTVSHELIDSGSAAIVDDSHQFSNPLGLTTNSPPPLHSSAMEAHAHAHAQHLEPELEHHLPTTIAPSQLTMSIAPSSLNIIPTGAQPLSLYSSEEHEHQTVLPGIESARLSVELPPVELEHAEALHGVSQGTNEHLLTLPMFATTRELYTETLRSARSAMLRYNKYFQTESAGFPNQELVQEVDSVFAKLLAHCDLPMFPETKLAMSTLEMMKHATGTNSKFLFIHEFLNHIKGTNTRVLILSQPGLIFDFLEAIVSLSGYKYTTYLNSQMATPDDDSEEKPHVILETTDQDVSRVPRIDVVILFDSAARSVDIPRSIPDTIPVLSLVITYSIEHIDLRLSDDLDELERRNAMSLVLVESQKEIQNSLSDKEPHKLAEMFADFVIDPTSEPAYEPQTIPDEYFEVYLSSQASQSRAIRQAATVASQIEPGHNSRKRLFDGDDAGAATPSKRPRTAIKRTSQLMSDLLKDTLARYKPRLQGCAQTVEVPIDQLERLAATIHRLQETAKGKKDDDSRLRKHVFTLEDQLKSQNSIIETQQQRLVESLRQGTVLEDQLRIAEEYTEKIQKELDTVLLREKTRALSAPPKAPSPVAEPLTDVEASLQETRVKLEAAEKKVKGTNKELDYIREAYQTASNSASELGRENKDLKHRISELEHLAGEQLAKIHETNTINTIRDLDRQLRDARTMITHREEDLDRAQKELRTIKNGRRETRQTSVPRSPRVPMMSSPRPRGGAGSRGTSPAAAHNGSSTSVTPVPGMSHYQTPVANPRLTHLRD